MSDRMTVLHAGEGETLWIAGDRIRVLAQAASADGRGELFEVEGPRGSGPPPHRHGWAEAYFVLSGEIDVQLDGGSRRLRPGDYLQMPADALHTYRVESERAVFLAMTSPGGALPFFREMALALADAAPDAPDARDRAMSICAAHGVRFEVPGAAR